MSLLLYINGDVVDLSPGTVIAQTRQVNDLNSLSNRQTSYTNKFNLPKTAHNIRVMNYLSLTGNTSNIPYQKNECSLYGATGECFVYNGRAVISDAGDSFEVVIYDGIIDLYKAIENKNLSALGLEEISHTKTFNAIKQSWTIVTGQEHKYTYILADFNGDNTVSAPAPSGLSANLDYIVPAVKVSYLWEKIFTQHGFDYTGSIFQSDDFKNLWVTLPKGVPNLAEQNTLVYQGYSGSAYPSYMDNTLMRCILNLGTNSTQGQPFIQLSQGTQDPAVNDPNKHIKILQTGRYKIEINGTLKANAVSTSGSGGGSQSGGSYGGSSTTYTNTMLHLHIGKNSETQPLTNMNVLRDVKMYHDGASPINFYEEFDLEAGSSVCFLVSNPFTQYQGFQLDPATYLNIKVTHVVSSEIDFSQEFSDFSIRDFLTEIVQRFGLTMYKRKFENHFDFLMLNEVFETSPVENWSDKFIKKNAEDYITGNYAQQNWFRYTYNDKEQSHNDYYLPVTNTNLPDTANLYTSRIYSPERQKVNYLNRQTNIYKLWEKEIVENPGTGQPPVKYKPLDKRYYLIRAKNVNTGIYLQSNANSIQSGQCSNYLVEDYTGLSFEEIVTNYYSPLKRILQNTLVITALFWLSEVDVANFDFRKRYFIEQLGGNFVINKISNYIPGKPTVCELLRV